MTYRMTHQHTKPLENSWYIKTGDIHHFICACGQVDQLYSVVSLVHHPKHTCSACENSHYLDSMMFLTNFNIILWSIFYWATEEIKGDEGWEVTTYAKIPIFDYTIQKICLRKIILSTASLSFKGSYTYKENSPNILKKYIFNHNYMPKKLNETIEKKLINKLFSFVLSTSEDSLNWINEQTIPEVKTKAKIRLYSFFLKNSHLKEYDFYYWKAFDCFHKISRIHTTVSKMLAYICNFRKEKSIKRAYFSSYKKSMHILSSYNPTADYVFSRHIEDRNYLLQLINIDVNIKESLFDELFIDDIEVFFIFLKEHYTQKEITKFFVAAGKDDLLRDTLRMFRGETANFIREHFQKIPLTIQKLHDAFVRISILQNDALKNKREFTYHTQELSKQVILDGFEYRLPLSTATLYEWSQYLHNCMYGYCNAIHKSNTIIYGVFKDNRLLYAIEIKNHNIVQALGKFNSHIEKEDRILIDRWFKDNYFY